ncbi:MAG TPA: transcriptional activator NhaR [Sandaracinaceae bacterium LLY-WYZ-13_1]|nr:transcriptional activator NhaR [Sandaracinaceae bacterium LLY-WYZ-13_1]
MDWLNYHHLLYFWMVAKEGTVTAAAKQLRLSQPTVSEQVKSLEDSLGEALFHRVGRRLELTDVGQVVYRYADEIFGLGREMMDTLKGRPTGRPAKLHVGVSDLVPKLILHRLLEPALRLEEPVQVVCREDKTERLLAELSVQGLDLVLAEVPIGGQARVRAYNHLLGECGTTFYGHPALTAELADGFPGSLDGAPVLMPTENTILRRQLEHWFEKLDLRPRIVAEFEDSALLKVFGQYGEGVFPGPTAIEGEITAQYGVQIVGRTEELRERFYAITVERRIKHPAVLAISETARARIFG